MLEKLPWPAISVILTYLAFEDILSLSLVCEHLQDCIEDIKTKVIDVFNPNTSGLFQHERLLFVTYNRIFAGVLIKNAILRDVLLFTGKVCLTEDICMDQALEPAFDRMFESLDTISNETLAMTIIRFESFNSYTLRKLLSYQRIIEQIGVLIIGIDEGQEDFILLRLFRDLCFAKGGHNMSPTRSCHTLIIKCNKQKIHPRVFRDIFASLDILRYKTLYSIIEFVNCYYQCSMYKDDILNDEECLNCGYNASNRPWLRWERNKAMKHDHYVRRMIQSSGCLCSCRDCI